MQLRVGIAIALVVCVTAPILADDSRTEPHNPPSMLWGDLDPGPHSVGFQVIELWDRSRSFPGLDARPMQVSLWYPATPTATASTMAYREYVHLYQPGLIDGFPRSNEAERRRHESEWGQRFEAVQERFLAAATAAFRDAPRAAGTFPLVLYAPGYGASPSSHTVTAEFIASHGYVVAASPSLGEGPVGITFDDTGLETQARDLEFTLGAVGSGPAVHQGPVGIVGFSFGGSSALLTAMRHERVGAVVSLDGSIGARYTFAFTRAASGYAAARLRAPLLHLQRLESSARDLALVESLALSERRWLDVQNAEHLDFTPLPTMSHAVGVDVPEHRLRVYRTAVVYMLRFLNAHLKGRGSDAAGLESALVAGGLEASRMDLVTLPSAADAPTSIELWQRMEAPATTESAVASYRSLATRLGGIPLMTNGQFDRAGSTLLHEAPELAVATMQLWAEVYPNVFFAHYSLGEAYLEIKDFAGAIRAFQNALELDPGSALAREGLNRAKELGRAAGGDPGSD